MKEFPSAGPVNVIIRMAAGQVDVIAEARDTTVVDVSPGSTAEASRTAAAQTRVEMKGDLLIVETPTSHGLMLRRPGQVNIRVHVPTDSRLQFHSSSGDLRCAGVLRELDASTASGDVRVDTVSGGMTRKSASGDTQFNVVGGDLSINSASGDMHGGVVGGGMTAKSASGDIRVDAIGGSVKGQSASGDIEVDSLSSGVARFSTASGDLQLGVAEGVAVWLDLSSVSGDARSELPVHETAPNGGSARLNLHGRTVSGDITIRRAAGRAGWPAGPIGQPAPSAPVAPEPPAVPDAGPAVPDVPRPPEAPEPPQAPDAPPSPWAPQASAPPAPHQSGAPAGAPSA